MQQFVEAFDVPPFLPLAGVNTVAATPSTTSIVNVKRNVRLGLPRLHQQAEFCKTKGDLPIALVGGGPSVKGFVDEIKKFKTVFACGSSHDWIRSQGIVPTYAGICDPDPVGINYFKDLHPETRYLIASSAHEDIIRHFQNHQLVLWHCHSDDYIKDDELRKIEPDYQAIGGGCTIGLRAISIAILLGYSNLHMFGYDSCLSDKESYAYELSTQEEKDNQGQVFPIKIGFPWKDGPREKTYHCLGYHLAQAHHFKDFMTSYGSLFKPTVYGEGLIPDLCRAIQNGQKEIDDDPVARAQFEAYIEQEKEHFERLAQMEQPINMVTQ